MKARSQEQIHGLAEAVATSTVRACAMPLVSLILRFILTDQNNIMQLWKQLYVLRTAQDGCRVHRIIASIKPICKPRACNLQSFNAHTMCFVNSLSNHGTFFQLRRWFCWALPWSHWCWSLWLAFSIIPGMQLWNGIPQRKYSVIFTLLMPSNSMWKFF